MRIRTLSLAVAVFAIASPSQTGPVPFFELLLPGVVIAGGSNVVADIPIPQINQVTIQVMGSADTNLTYGDLRVRINGKGARNIFDSGSNARGKFLRMTPETLKMRRDQLFDRLENTVEVYGKDRRGREYYQNWILRSSSGNGNPYFTYASSMSPLDEQGIPPDLEVQLPNAPVVFPSGKASVAVAIKSVASAANGITAATVDGKSVAIAAGREISLTEQVVVARGAKSIVVEVTDGKGNKRSTSVPVIYPGAGVPPPRIGGDAWAIVIGTSRYSAKKGAPPALPLAAYDTKALAAALAQSGFKTSNILVLLDEDATAQKIRTALGDFAARAKPEDLFLLYWCTQGLHDPASPDKVYLSAHDTQAQQLADTAVETSELQLLLDRAVRSRHTLLFFDAEHPLGIDWGFQGRPIVNTHLLNLFDDQLGRSVIVAGTSPGEADDRRTRSEFSAAITEGLAGAADVDQNRVVTPREIANYVSQRVRQTSGGSQLPRALVSKKEEEMPVLTLAPGTEPPPAPAPKAVAPAKAGPAGRAGASVPQSSPKTVK